MIHLVITLCLFLSTTTFGQVTLDDLPKPVVRIINNTYKKQEVSLEDIASGKQELHSDRFYALYTGNSKDLVGYLHLGKVNTCRSGGCSGPENHSGEDYSGEYFDYLILFDIQLAIEKVQVFNYQASYGHEIAARGWLKQFSGFKGENSLEPGKNIDVISGATVSVHAITNDVQWKTKILQQLVQ